MPPVDHSRRVVVLHAFSRKNTGDGLLVDLTLDLLEEAGVPRAQCRVLALDAASFPELRDVHQIPGEPRGKPSLRAAGAALELLRSGAAEVLPSRGGAIGRLVRGARGFVAVGGGYLVADSVVRAAGVSLNHLPQILAAGRSGRPSIYLPQSIGPLAPPVAPVVKRALSRIDVIYARDDDTFRELAGVTDVRRCPDLAVLQLARRLADLKTPSGGGRGPTVIVPRELSNAPGYVERLRVLADPTLDPRWAVQADVDGPRSDRRFLARHGLQDAGDLQAVLARGRPGVVVSVRLHGAIGALLAGWPAIHLSYERKGWGAYQDLGLSTWVHDARSFDVATVRAQVEALHADPRPMFDAIAARHPQLIAARTDLVRTLAERLAH